MNALWIVVAAAGMGVDHGWEPLPGGGVEFVVQIEPEALELLLNEDDVSSVIPPHLVAPDLDVRRIRVTFGKAKLAQDPPAPSDPPLDDLPSDTAAAPPILRSPEGSDLADNDQTPTANDRSRETPQEPQKLPDNAKVAAVSSKPAAFQEPLSQHNANKRPSLTGRDVTTSKTAEAKPWLPLIVAIGALAASLGANVYLGWVAWGARARCKSLLAELGDTPVVVA